MSTASIEIRGDPQSPITPDQKIRRALFSVLDLLDDTDKERLAALIDTAPEPIVGREPTKDEIQMQQFFKANARSFLRSLPPELGISYQSLMKKIDKEIASRSTKQPPTNVLSSPKSPGKQKKAIQSPIKSPSKSPSKSSPKSSSPKSPEKRRSSKKSSKQPETTLVDVLCILKLQATWNEGRQPRPQEIIEFSSILLHIESGDIQDTFHCHVRPDVNPTLSEYCTKITGVTQKCIDKQGIPLSKALKDHRKWLKSHKLVCIAEAYPENSGGGGETWKAPRKQKTFLYIITGDWDLKVCLSNQLEYHGQEVPLAFQSWVNLKSSFESIYRKSVLGIDEMISILKIQPKFVDGSGVDICRRTAQVCNAMIRHAWIPNPSVGVGRIGTKLFWHVQQRRPWPPQQDPISPYKMIYLIRNGQTEADVENETGISSEGTRGCSLSEKGTTDAKQIVNLFLEEVYASIDLVVTSPCESALHTALLGFPDRPVVVNYDLAGLGKEVPESPIGTVVTVLEKDIKDRPEYAKLDYITARLDETVSKPQGNEPASRKVRRALEWLYVTRKEKSIAVICQHNVLRTAFHGTGIPISADFTAPIKCQLFTNGNIVPI